MSSNPVCNHTPNEQIGPTPRTSPILLITGIDYWPNWTPLTPITITHHCYFYYVRCKCSARWATTEHKTC